MQHLTVLPCLSASKPYSKMQIHNVDPIHGIQGQKTHTGKWGLFIKLIKETSQVFFLGECISILWTSSSSLLPH